MIIGWNTFLYFGIAVLLSVIAWAAICLIGIAIDGLTMNVLSGPRVG